MKIEIVEFYPFEPISKKTHFRGSLHIYLIDYELDIRGIFVKRANKSWFFSMPKQSAKDMETDQVVRYPIISFSGQNKDAELMELIRTQGKSYIEKYVENL